MCPECRRIIDAQSRLRDNQVIMRKRCPDHGWFKALVYNDAELYTSSLKYNKPGTIPLKFSTEIKEGCPYDCGLCPEHQQHACLGIIEVNTACNFACPVCFSDAGPGFNLTLQEVEDILDHFVETEGNPEVVQFSGGEPPAVKGINFQPMFHAGRHIAADPLQRLTVPDVLRAIDEQCGGTFLASDFVPVPCCFPTCNSVTYAWVDGETVLPMTRIVEVDDY